MAFKPKEIAAQVGEERDDDDNVSVIACTTAKRARGTIRATGGGARVGTAKVTGQNGSESELRHEGTRRQLQTPKISPGLRQRDEAGESIIRIEKVGKRWILDNMRGPAAGRKSSNAPYLLHGPWARHGSFSSLSGPARNLENGMSSLVISEAGKGRESRSPAAASGTNARCRSLAN